MDEVDDSQKAERLYRQEALGNRGQVGNPGFVSFSICAECGEEIPERRRQVIPGCRLCAACQAEQDGKSHFS
jgi:phage/conjugal plasmid C-4 type zinc finger TraR family protein